MAMQAKLTRADGVSIEASGDGLADVVGAVLCLNSESPQYGGQHFTEAQIDEIAQRLDARFVEQLTGVLNCLSEKMQSRRKETA